jgi:hypothetical protein
MNSDFPAGSGKERRRPLRAGLLNSLGPVDRGWYWPVPCWVHSVMLVSWGQEGCAHQCKPDHCTRASAQQTNARAAQNQRVRSPTHNGTAHTNWRHLAQSWSCPGITRQ